MSAHDFSVYATALDAYRNMVNSSDVWQNYWAFSENPPHTEEQFHWLQVEQFIDGLNRVDGVPSEAASRGTAFNELIDAFVEWRAPKMVTTTNKDDSGRAVSVTAEVDGFTFTFPLDLLKDYGKRYERAVCQYLTKGTMHTRHGIVQLYGYIDELMSDRIVDIKTTGRYEFPKFANNAQHLVYPYCLRQEGMKLDIFDYDIVVFSKYGAIEQYTERYIWEDSNEQRLREWVEDLCDWLTRYAPLIQNPALFGHPRPADYVGVPVAEIDPDTVPAECREIIENINQTHLDLGQ